MSVGPVQWNWNSSASVPVEDDLHFQGELNLEWKTPG